MKDKLEENEALKYFKPPFEYDKHGQTIWCKGANGHVMALQVRGWGNLIGGAANQLLENRAAKIQDEFGQWVVDTLNNTVKEEIND